MLCFNLKVKAGHDIADGSSEEENLTRNERIEKAIKSKKEQFYFETREVLEKKRKGSVNQQTSIS